MACDLAETADENKNRKDISVLYEWLGCMK
jgi:hypothetical protein